MNVTLPWNIVYLIGFIIFFTLRGVYAHAANHERPAISRFGGLERFLLAVMFPPTVLLPLLFLFTPLLAFADYQTPALVQSCGSAVMLIALWLFWRSHADLGKNWSVSVEIHEGHELVTEGVYRYIRHPMYAAIWLWAIAQGMLLANWIAGWSVLPAFALMYWLRTPREEELMSQIFGDQYREYIRQTGRLLPRIKRNSGPIAVQKHQSFVSEDSDR